MYMKKKLYKKTCKSFWRKAIIDVKSLSKEYVDGWPIIIIQDVWLAAQESSVHGFPLLIEYLTKDPHYPGSPMEMGQMARNGQLKSVKKILFPRKRSYEVAFYP
jgi:hypothetical protein